MREYGNIDPGPALNLDARVVEARALAAAARRSSHARWVSLSGVVLPIVVPKGWHLTNPGGELWPRTSK